MSSDAALRVRIVSADFYSASPCPELDETYNQTRGFVIRQLPIIRIFGITPIGEKACVHVHGVFPYLYVPFPSGATKGGSIHYEVAESLDSALNSAYGSKTHHVSKVTTVSGKAFYGYHSKAEDFLRIEFYHPSSIKRAMTLLLAGAVCNQALQPHEAHVPFILQFFIDFNLYGMNFLICSQFKSRISSDVCGTSTGLSKTTKCSVEVDVSAGSILNPSSSSRVMNPGLANIREEEERRQETDGVPLVVEGTPGDCDRDLQPTSSDLKFQELLLSALKERKKTELLSTNLDTSVSTSASQPAQVAFDKDDLSVLKILFDRLVGEERPDEDSVLGFTPSDENHDEPELDLSQPYISLMADDNEEVPDGNENLSDTLVWPELLGLSQIDHETTNPSYLDGNMDEGTPEKQGRKAQRKSDSPRYIPLDVKLHKSPRRKTSGTRKSSDPSSPELFQKLQEEATSLRNIKSPKSKVDKGTYQFPTSSVKEDPDIICSSDDSGEEHHKKDFKFNFLGKSLRSRSAAKKQKKKSAKRVLFNITPPTAHDENSGDQSGASSADRGVDSTVSSEGFKISENSMIAHNETRCIVTSEEKVHLEEVAGSSLPSGSKDVPGERLAFSRTEENTRFTVSWTDRQQSPSNSHADLSNSSPEVSSLKIAFEKSDNLDSTQNDQYADELDATQCTITSFYGDTTLFPCSLDFNIILRPTLDAPSPADILSNLHTYGLESRSTPVPYYSDPRDVSTFKEVGLNVISLKSKYANDLEEYKGTWSTVWPHYRPSSRRIVILEPAKAPPSSSSILKELELLSQTSSALESTISQADSNKLSEDIIPPSVKKNKLKKKKNKKLVELDRRKRESGEIEHATPDNSGLFKLDFQNLQDAQTQTLHKFTTLMVMELHANSRGELRPDPDYDPVEAVFYTIVNDIPDLPDENLSPRLTGVIMVSPDDDFTQDLFPSSVIKKVKSEVELFTELIAVVDYHNPDIIAGYEIEMLSWGYLIERGYILGLNLMKLLSRIVPDSSEIQSGLTDKFSNKDYDLRIPGRIVLNVWRLMRYEVALMSYSFENVAYHVLHTRVPKYSFKTLTYWWSHFSKLYRHLVLKYYLTMVDGVEKILDQLNLIGRTCELASLFGIQFYEVFSRGSQFRVESMMLRLSRRLGYIAVSPSVEQRAAMRAPESLPLIMEPESRFYGDPVIVLDFQSLYPSMIIAYNYCFSTCLGRVSSLMESSEFKFGCTELQVPLKELLGLQKNLHVSPAGVVFVDKSVRLGVLPQMLDEILQTRLMVKSSMKRHKSDKLLSRVLDARQLGLKLIANVTYGYTSANFSGRMPCIEVGDSVVSKGRETLERAIQLVERTPEWRARVVYGDTDSLFVLCPGRSREEAFRIGGQIADRVTSQNPAPVKLKLEKVYQPCILQTKKRYVGFMYESPDQKKPVYDAKGIETVRRDGCPAVSKILEKSLKLLFEMHDVSVVKEYVTRQMVKVLSGRLNPSELTFAKEYRGMSGYQPNAPVPALKIAKEELARDRRGEPRSGERVGYVVVAGPPGVPLISLVRSLSSFICRSEQLPLNADYYLTKAILPPLARCFTLLGVDVFQWYSSLPKRQLVPVAELGLDWGGEGGGRRKKGATIAQYFRRVQCLSCRGESSQSSLCSVCQASPASSLARLSQTVSRLEAKRTAFHKLCGSCCFRNYENDCVSYDCPIFYRRRQATVDCSQSPLLYDTIQDLSEF